MDTCPDCHSQYDQNNVNLPNPVPDFMCTTCGTQLTEQQVKAILEKGN